MLWQSGVRSFIWELLRPFNFRVLSDAYYHFKMGSIWREDSPCHSEVSRLSSEDP